MVEYVIPRSEQHQAADEAIANEVGFPVTDIVTGQLIAQTPSYLEALKEETLIFQGTAREACRAFPSNVNVSAALSLAGVGPDRTHVRVIAVPGGSFNQHRIEVAGEFGRLAVEIENVPSATNPRTGLLSIYSSIAMLAEYARTRRKDRD